MSEELSESVFLFSLFFIFSHALYFIMCFCSRKCILVCFIGLHLVCASDYVYEKEYDILVCLSDCIWYVHLTMKYDIYWCAYQIAFGMCI